MNWTKLSRKQKKETEPWIRNKADELAIDNGCWFDPSRAAFMIWWVERNCRLYEGEGFAGQPVILNSIAEQPDWRDIPDCYPRWADTNGNPLAEVLGFYVDRMKWHNALVQSGHHMDWPFECHARIYGWQREASARWQRLKIHQVRRFKIAHVWIPKKNKKTPSLAFNALYLTFGDNEPGAKTFIAAKDGTQANRVWDHAHMMLKQSEELDAVCKVNLTTHRVTYLPNQSHFEPLSSSNSNTRESKEGLNGNVLVDETHVVDRDFMTILKYAGASRPQSLHMAFSTAGKNPEGYGKEQWDKGEAVNSGELKIDNYFHQSYHAPQTLTLDDARSDPEHFIRMANPALNHTVGMEELLPAFHESIDSPADWADYMMYRLNVWQHASQVWLGPGVWDNCRNEFEEDEVEGRQWVLGLDLARKFDLAACVPSSPNGDGGVDIIQPMFFCNQDRIKELASKYPQVLKWVEDGFIIVSDGNVTDMSDIKEWIRSFAEKRKVVGIVYDATYAEMLIQNLTEGERGPTGEIVWPALEIGEQAISQGILTQTGPVADFENDLKRGAIRHDGNPVLSWQFGHATVKEDSRGHRQIQKENRKSFRTVDGCQASVMSRWGALDCTEWKIVSHTFYETHEVESI